LVHMQYEDTGSRTGKTLLMEGEDLQAAEQLVTQGTLFWAPAKTWQEWIAVSPTSKTGWWVKATGTRKEGKQITLEIRTVQRDEFHRLGDIRVDGPLNIKAGQAWRLRQVLQAMAPTLTVLAEDELEWIVGGFQRCEALQTFQDGEPKVEAERSEEGREPPIQRPREQMAVALPVISFEVNWGAAQQRVGTGQEKGELRGVLCRKGQAHRMDTSRQKMMKTEKRSIRRGGQDLRQKGNQSEGGRTLDWTLTSELRRSRGLKLMVRAHTITADPSYRELLRGTRERQGTTRRSDHGSPAGNQRAVQTEVAGRLH
jgi:hypothetical protein